MTRPWLLALSTALILPRAALAQTGPAARTEAVAQALFEEGVALMGEQRFEEACPKLAESQRLDPGGGTVLNLASCLERLGQLASAYAMYADALSAAIRDGRKERETVARERLTTLLPQLTRLELRLAEPSLEGELEVELDGVRLAPSAWRTPLPIDPGTHAVAARAPGRVAWSRTIEVLANGDRIRIEIPPLAVVVAATAPSPPPPPPPRREEPRPARIVAFAGGSVALAIGLGAGIGALLAKDASDDGCPTRDTCTADGAASMRTATTLAWTANVAVGVGLVALGVGAYLTLTGGRPKRVTLGPGVLGGTF